jgi:hypothetical protein
MERQLAKIRVAFGCPAIGYHSQRQGAELGEPAPRSVRLSNCTCSEAARSRDVARCSAMGALGDFEDRLDFHTDVFRQAANPDR